MRLVEQGDCFRKSRIEFRSEEFRCCAVCSGRFCAGCSSRRAGATAGWHLCSDHHLLWHCSIHLGGRRSQTPRPNIPIPRHSGEGPSAFLLPRVATQQGSATTEPSPAPPKRFGDRNILLSYLHLSPAWKSLLHLGTDNLSTGAAPRVSPAARGPAWQPRSAPEGFITLTGSLNYPVFLAEI